MKNKVFIIGNHSDVTGLTSKILNNNSDIVVINDENISNELTWNNYVSKITNRAIVWSLNNDNKSILDKYFDVTNSNKYEVFKNHYDSILAKTSKLSKSQREVILELHKTIYK